MKILRRRTGKVFLVGAGPGDPELLTVKAVRCLSCADVVIHDRLVNPGVLNLIPASAEKIPVGKKGGHYGFPQEKINKLMVSRSLEGNQVIRLKGGDPFLFGRGAEEMLCLARHKIPFEIVPGLSSVFAVPSFAGIPMTHRNMSSSVLVLSGHLASSSDHVVPWDLAAKADTVVFLMPLGNLKQIISQLVLHGRPLDTLAAVLGSGTLEQQRKVVGTLSSIVSQTEKSSMKSPALLVAGQVVQFHALLDGCSKKITAVKSELTSKEKEPA